MSRTKTLLLVLTFVFLATFLIFSYLGWWGDVLSNPQTSQLPYFLLRTMLRMLAAYALVVVFSLTYGIIAGLYRAPRIFMLPLLDILQSIPVLGYIPAALFFFLGFLPGELGFEVASIFLIFTGMAWAVTFSILSGVRSIPNDLREASNAYGFRGWRYVYHVVLPAIIPPFITGSVLAWGGGWYFLVAAEMLTYGATAHFLPGIGTYLGNAVYNLGNIPSALFGLVVFVSVVYTINMLVWKPLLSYSRRFKIQTMKSEIIAEEEEDSAIVRLAEWVRAHSFWFDSHINEPVERFLVALRKYHVAVKFIPGKRRHLQLPAWKLFSIYTALFLVVMLWLLWFFSSSFSVPFQHAANTLASHNEIFVLPYLAFRSFLRILVAYIIALCWTLIAAIVVVRSKRLSQIFFPIFDVGQSTPALALFPFIVIFVISIFGGGQIGVEVAAILLLLTGTQWYLLFNIIGALNNIPGDILEASRAFGLKNRLLYRTIFLPAIFPGIVLGSVQAWGGAWNSLIVSEYIVYNNEIHSVDGIGAFLSQLTSSPSPDPLAITLCIGTMTIVILMMNYVIWRRLFNYAERFRFDGV